MSDLCNLKLKKNVRLWMTWKVKEHDFVSTSVINRKVGLKMGKKINCDILYGRPLSFLNKLFLIVEKKKKIIINKEKIYLMYV